MVVKDERCTGRALTEEKLLRAVLADDLAADQPMAHPHGDDQQQLVLVLPDVPLVFFEALLLEVGVVADLALMKDVGSLLSGLLLLVADVAVCCLDQLPGFVRVHHRVAFGMPHFDFCHGRMVLDEGVRAHVLHRPVAVGWLVLRGVALPQPNGWHAVNDHAVQSAEVKEVHYDSLIPCSQRFHVATQPQTAACLDDLSVPRGQLS